MVGRLLIIVFALVYTAGQLVLTMFTTGAGHGTMVILATLPTWMLFLASIVLLFWSENRHVRRSIVILMAINYLATAGFVFLFEFDDSFHYTIKYFGLEPVLLVSAIVWYLVGQVLFWLFYMRRVGAASGKLP